MLDDGSPGTAILEKTNKKSIKIIFFENFTKNLQENNSVQVEKVITRNDVEYLPALMACGIKLR